MAPAVSIIMATYNRSNILGYAIRSVLQGDFQDWELIVVGDSCTDNTAEVVESFSDSRIRFINLEQNFGEQSGPNNVGVEAATGDFLAFLNHDDFWLPNHLSRSIRLLKETGADLVFGQGLVVVQEGKHTLTGALCGTAQPYQPRMSVPASLWVMRKELASRIGPWRPAREMMFVPSQEWLYRAHRVHARLYADPVLSAVIITSGNRVNSYRDRQDAEHAYWVAVFSDPLHLLNICTGLHGQALDESMFSPGINLVRAFKSAIRRLLSICGFWPPSPKFWLKYYRKGSFINEIRRTRGLNTKLP